MNNPVNDLADKHGGVWGEHPDYPVETWKYDVANGDTRNSYWQWVLAEIEAHGENED
jgi:hypothetical protein